MISGLGVNVFVNVTVTVVAGKAQVVSTCVCKMGILVTTSLISAGSATGVRISNNEEMKPVATTGMKSIFC